MTLRLYYILRTFCLQLGQVPLRCINKRSTLAHLERHRKQKSCSQVTTLH